MGFRKCSQCEKTGHNSRTCNNLRRKDGGIVKLFGVELASLASSNHDFSFSSHKFRNNGYPSDATSQKIRKKGVAWSEEEHKLFILGIEKHGKGDWKGISSNYVKTRTPTQVASHAQKYFLRQKNNIANNNKYGPTLLSLVGRNADSSVDQVNRKESSIFSDANIIYKNSKSYGYTMPEIPFCRLFSNCASPSLELSLGTPSTPTCLEYSSSFWQRRYAEIIYDLNQ